MSLYNYVGETERLYRELIASLTAEDIAVLRTEISHTGKSGWDSWFSGNIENVHEYAVAAPSRRSKLKKWSDPALRRWLILGSIYYLLGGYCVLMEIEKQFLFPGCSYREMAANAGKTYRAILNCKINPWPFDDPNPLE